MPICLAKPFMIKHTVDKNEKGGYFKPKNENHSGFNKQHQL